eukprot:448185_1
MECVREYGIIDAEYEKLIDKIIVTVQNDPNSFSQSQLYSSQKEMKFIDIKERNSVYKLIKNEQLFNLIDQCIDKINQMDKYYKFMLFKNDITFIKYSQNGFFKPHEDYLSITSNILEEWTMILCVDSNCINHGGETVLYINDYFKHTSTHTITPKHCLLFRKDIKHEALIINNNNGYKHILTMNIWAFNKNDNYSQKNIIISDEEQDGPPIVLPLNVIMEYPQTLLAKKLEQSNLNDMLIEYKREKYSWEFYQKIVYKIYNKMYIKITDFEQYRQDILRFGFTFSNIFIDMTVSNTIDQEPALKKRKLNNNNINIKNKEIYDFNGKTNIYLCDNISQQTYLLNLIKQSKLQYIPFKIIFCEGVMSFGGGWSGFEPCHIEMKPIWESVGECDNIIFYEIFGQNSDELGCPEINTFNLTKCPINGTNISDLLKIVFREYDYTYNDKDKERQHEYKECIRHCDDSMSINGFDLNNKLSYKHSEELFNKLDVLRWSLKGNDWIQRRMIFDEIIQAQLATFAPITLSDLSHFEAFDQHKLEKYGENIIEFIDNYLKMNGLISPFESVPINERISLLCKSRFIYDIDESNKMILNKRYYKQIVQKINKLNLNNYVKNNLNSMNYNFHQIKQTYSNSFCNEEVYGNFNLLVATGFIQIDLRKDDLFIISGEFLKVLEPFLPTQICNVVLLYLPIEP